MSDPFKRWYKSNRKEFNSKRQSRYANDPEYAEQIRLKQREYRKRKKQEGLLESEKRQVYEYVAYTVYGDGTNKKGYRIGYTCEEIGISKSCFAEWIKKETIPDTPYRTDAGDRIWTRKQIDLMKPTIAKYLSKRNKEKMYEELLKAWQDI